MKEVTRKVVENIYQVVSVKDEAKLTRPTGRYESKKTTAFVDAIQTGERDVLTDIAVLRVTQTDYGFKHGEIFLDAFSFDAVDGDGTLELYSPQASVALDAVGAAKLIEMIARAFKWQVAVPRTHRNRKGRLHD